MFRRATIMLMLIVTILSLIIILCTNVLVTADDNVGKYVIPYRSYAYDSILTIQRFQPFVLFATSVGVQALINNGTCFDNLTSIYHNTDSPIRYQQTSVKSNFIYLLNAGGASCVKSLFNDKWIYAVLDDIANECSWSTFDGTEQFYQLSESRRLIYALTADGQIRAVSILRQTNWAMVELQGEHPVDGGYREASLFRMTDFAGKGGQGVIDDVLIGAPNRSTVFVLSTTGRYRGALQMMDGDSLQAVATNHFYQRYYFAVIRSDSLLLLKVTGSLVGDGPQKTRKFTTMFSWSEARFFAMDMTNHYVAMLMRKKANKNGDSEPNSTKTIHLEVNVMMDTDSADANRATLFVCQKADGLLGVDLVDVKDPLPTKDVCAKDGPEFNESICDPDNPRGFHRNYIGFVKQLHLVVDDVQRELTVKTAITITLSLISVLAWALFQLLTESGIISR